VLDLKYLGAIGQFMRRQVDFSERSLPDQSPKSVVANRFEVMAREFARAKISRSAFGKVRDRTREAPDTSEQAITC
jgi:hypothetical protein